ncbi:hypothetical protein SAY86_018382 [Trapa natans]|uniref:Uncharacterized protein n=1 Tax=Trapa natans TaxID=22666 RepID=A0AAN7LG52_TRANT|nr:hypothetical protein SAY86_018382 [Trapa natans]
MEEKQLDFNQPFLSVRRHSSNAVASEAQERRRKAGSSFQKLPPLPHYRWELKSGPVSKPGNVPFEWEKAPGKPKEDKQLQKNNAALERRPAAPKLPPGSTLKHEVKDQDAGKDSKPTVTRSVSQEGFQDASSEEGSEAFLDAMDTLSRSESFLNCSVTSGLSGLNGPDPVSTERLNAEPVAQDFMMGRFLSAAKAMASDTPQHSTRKPMPLVQESPRPTEVKKDSPPAYQNRPREREDRGRDDDETSPAKVCGLLPWFCSLNPVPGIGMKGMHLPGPNLAGGVRENSSSKRTTPCTALNEDKPEPVSKSGMGHEKDGKRLEGLNLYRRLQGNGQFLEWKEDSFQAASEAECTDGTSAENSYNPLAREGSNPTGKRCMKFGELLASEGKGWGSVSSTRPRAEKTLYVDSIHLGSHRNSPSAYSSASSSLPSKDDDVEAEVSAIASLLTSPSRETTKSDLPQDKLADLEAEEEIKMASSANEHRPDVESREKNSEEAHSNGKTDVESTLSAKMVSSPEMTAVSSNSTFHLPPPLPKSPSDSWLSRTLLAVSSKCPPPSTAPPPGSAVVPSRRAAHSKSPLTETRWETIVRTSNVRHGHLRFSEELLPPVPEA